LSYKAIIADDEPKLIQLIKLLGKWEELDIEIVDECLDGRTALESIKRNRPDFVLSDIKMPELDGLELIQEVRKSGVDCFFVLISGYRHFEYARSAISLNVVDYLLKPIDEEQLNITLEGLCRQMRKKEADQASFTELDTLHKQQSREQLKVFWNHLRGDVVNGRLKTTDPIASLQVYNDTYHTSFTKPCFQVVTISTDSSGVFQNDNSILQGQIDQFIAKISNEHTDYYYNLDYCGGILVINFDEYGRKTVRDNITALYYALRDMSEIYGQFRLNLGVGRAVDSIRDLPRSYNEALAAEWGRLITVQNGILEYSQVAAFPHFSFQDICPKEDLSSLCDCVKYLRREELGSVFQRLAERARMRSNSYPGDMSDVFFDLVGAITKNLSEDKRRRMVNDCFYAYLEARNFGQVMKLVYEALDQYVKEEMEAARQKAKKPIHEAQQFIRENYFRGISQEEVAAYSNVSPAYLSKLFKSELGIGFNDYLTKVRLHAAEELLANSTLNIKEIALAVGYPDEKYFSRLFKKNSGIKPSEYRKIYG
jgi:two-component system response regulator YesN